MLTGLHTNTTDYFNGSYEDDRDLTIKISEDINLYSGNNTGALQPMVGLADQHLVIGYGYDLLVTATATFEADLIELGIILTQNQLLTLRDTLTDYKAGTIGASDAAQTLSFINLGDENHASDLLQLAVDRFEDIVTARLAVFGETMAHSRERAALVSMAYNGGVGLLGPNLMGAIQDGNRAVAWYEIRYRSNGNQLGGLAKRRYYESQLFGLYGSGVTEDNITEEDTKKIYRMYTENRNTILAYEQEYSAYVANANTDYEANQVQTLESSLETAYQYLKENYLDILGENVAIDVKDIQIGSDNADTLSGTVRDGYQLGSGNEQNDLILGEGGNDNISGGKGDDVLYGGEGVDEIYGGAGDDNLYGNDDNGQDTLKDGNPFKDGFAAML